MRVSILGAGAFGTALAIALAKHRPGVTLWARDAAQLRNMQTARCNQKRLPNMGFPGALGIAADLAECAAAEIVLLAVPMQQLGGFLSALPQKNSPKYLVSCCKGIDLETGKGASALLQAQAPNAQAAVLTGPSFATDLAAGSPTALSLACADAAAGLYLQAQLSTPSLRLYRSTDVIGAELGGGLKNVIAIACGVTIGAGLGDSARAALMARGYVEMQRFAASLGARDHAMESLSGLGDLSLTCMSDKSRNYRYGHALGQQKKFDPLITVEGVATAKAALALAKDQQIDLPITQVVVQLSEDKIEVAQAVDLLMSRPQKQE